MRLLYKSPTGDVFEYETIEDRNKYGSPDLVQLTPGEVEEYTNPQITEEQMRLSEIAQDKEYLSNTDWIIAKIGEAQFMSQDTTELLSKYSSEIQQRELARIRIRMNTEYLNNNVGS